METLSTRLLEHYSKSKPVIIESMNSMVEKNYDKITKIWNDTGNPVPMKKAKKLNIGGMDYYYIASFYMGNRNLEWDAIMYTFIDSDKSNEDFIGKYDKDLIFFTSPNFKLPYPDLKGLIRYSSKFLEMYGYAYAKDGWGLYDIAERWIRRNTTPLILITADPIQHDQPGCNVLGKDYDENGVCIGRLEDSDPGLVKFMSFYPEEVLEELKINENVNNHKSIEKLLQDFRELVKPIGYKNRQDKVKWPDKFMLNKYYEYEN